jgi:hypothetical protein
MFMTKCLYLQVCSAVECCHAKGIIPFHFDNFFAQALIQASTTMAGAPAVRATLQYQGQSLRSSKGGSKENI